MKLSKFWAWALGLALAASLSWNVYQNGEIGNQQERAYAAVQAERDRMMGVLNAAVQVKETDATLRSNKLIKYIDELCSRLDLAAGMPRYSTYNDCVNKAGS